MHEMHGLLLSLNKLPVNIAVLDRAGVIIGVNGSWREFGEANDYGAPDAGVGANYLDVCGGQRLAALRNDLSALLRGDLDLFTTTYDCHSPTERRWFVLLGVRLSGRPSDGVALFHINVSDLVPLVFGAPELRTATSHAGVPPSGVTVQMIEEAVKRSVGEALSRSRSETADGDADKRKLLGARLSRRQTEILALLGEGHQNAEIAARLALSQNTVKLHVSDILKRLGLKSRTQAALLAAKLEDELRAMAAPPDQ